MKAKDHVLALLIAALGLPGVGVGLGCSSENPAAESRPTVAECAEELVCWDRVTDTASCGSEVTGADGATTGYVLCSDGAVHRANEITTDLSTEIDGLCSLEGAFCSVDSDCTEKENGACREFPSFFGPNDLGTCGCVYSCANDSECESAEVCLSADVAVGLTHSRNVCVQATCKTDEDCGLNECGLSIYYDGCSTSMRLACRTENDTCYSNEDCENNSTCGAGAESGVFECSQVGCAIGRPLTMEDGWRQAPVVERLDWNAPIEPELMPEDPETLRALSEYWQKVGALEHASIGSFLRHALELMGLGAPPDLLHDVHTAAIDEINHAKITFALASAYAGKSLGPGPLSIGDVRPRTDRRVIFRALVEEGCLGETLGAIEAFTAAEQTQDPVVRAALTQIAEEEAGHAALAWRTVQWLLSEDPSLRADLLEMSRVTLEALPAADPSPLAGYGLMSSATRKRVHIEALQGAVLPCMKALYLQSAELLTEAA